MHTATMERPAIEPRLILLIWLALAVGAGAEGLIERSPLPLPALILLLTGTLLLTLRRSAPLREWVWSHGPAPLVALHLTRFVGAAFLVLAARGELAPVWALPTGWGDIAVAVAAIPVLVRAAPFRTSGQRRALFAWNVFGLADMLMVMAGAARLLVADPSGVAVMQRLPMSVVPTFLVPLILTSHVMLFVWLARTRPGPR